jgi:hypothetical protein
MSMFARSLSILCSVSALAVTACGEDETFLPLTTQRPAPPDACPEDGIVLWAGFDTDGDGDLSEAEVLDETLVCDRLPGSPGDQGPPGRDALVDISEEAPGPNCPDGGQRIDVGIDSAPDPDSEGNGVLDPEEVGTTIYLCDGAMGDPGADFLVSTSTSVEDTCDEAFGGIRFDSGFDDNSNGSLDGDEVEFSTTVCAGEDGFNALLDIEAEPPGPNCSAGGQRATRGLDSNRDGTLDPSEIDEVSFLCNPIQHLVRTATVGPGAECATGGVRIDTGLDTDGSGTLEPTEATATRFVCDGAQAISSLVDTATVGPGADCANGGLEIRSGRDDDRDGTLDADEVQSTAFACNGEDGQDGRGNSAVRITSVPAGPNSDCPDGGVRIETGPDTDGDGTLSDTEVTGSQLACDAADDETTVTVTEFGPTEECIAGGRIVRVGRDENGDGELAGNEVASTTRICSSVPVLPIQILTDQDLGTVIETQSVEFEITATGGFSGGFSWSVFSGALPPGLNLDASGTPSTELDGAATSTGTFNFTIQVRDSIGGTDTQNFTLQVDPAPCAPGRDGLAGVSRTDISHSASLSSISRGLAVDEDSNGWVYIISEFAETLDRVSKDGLQDDDVTTLASLRGGQVGYEVEVAGDNIYVASDDSNCNPDCVAVISTDRGATWQNVELVDFGSASSFPNGEVRGLEETGSRVYLMTHASATTEIWSIPLVLTGTSTPVLEGSFSFGNCSSLTSDDDYFYTGCDGDDIVRIDRTTFAAESIYSDTGLGISSTGQNGIVAQDADGDGSADVLWFSGDNNGSGEAWFVCEPATAQAPAFAGSFADSAGHDEGLGFDPTQNRIWLHDESNELFRFE